MLAPSCSETEWLTVAYLSDPVLVHSAPHIAGHTTTLYKQIH